MTQHHTPGPWSQAELAPAEVIAGSDTMIASARSGLNGIDRDEAIANARLIAAAPDLLAALEKLVRAVDRMPANAADGIADEARAAIAKARNT